MENTPTLKNNCSNNINFFCSARSAFKYLLRRLNESGKRSILLPAYIGYTDREGSGVFDPVSSLKLQHDFYEVDDKLSVDIHHLESMFKKHKVDMLLIIHYFGFCQNDMKEIMSLCKKYNVLLIEDCAHAPHSISKYGELGGIGDFSFYSIHKYYPTTDGGILKVNNKEYIRFCNMSIEDEVLPQAETLQTLIRSNSNEINNKRRRNYLLLDRILEGISGVRKLFSHLPEGTSPHNYPLIVEDGLREPLYFELINNGIPAIALYYRMIKPIYEKGFENSIALSSSILNLPIHQDITEGDISFIVSQLKKSIQNVRVKN
jgi:dTDP-4-amino-4,6-dideoxygalactose transaminase